MNKTDRKQCYLNTISIINCAEWAPNKIDYLYIINFMINANFDALVDIDIAYPNKTYN